MTKDDRAPALTTRSAEIEAFLAKARSLEVAQTSGARGRLIFAIDATGSRQPTWDIACQLQGQMFEEVAAIGGLDIQLVYYRGLRECVSSRWIADARALGGLMERINCHTGMTQIGRVLAYAGAENARQKVQALVLRGRCDGRDT